MHGYRRPGNKLRSKKIRGVRPWGTNQTRESFVPVTSTGLELGNKCMNKTTHQSEVVFKHENVLFADNYFGFKSCNCVSAECHPLMVTSIWGTIMHTEHVFKICRSHWKKLIAAARYAVRSFRLSLKVMITSHYWYLYVYVYHIRIASLIQVFLLLQYVI